VLTIFMAWLIADFMSGVVHWAQDRLLDVETAFNFTNSIKRDNDLHHEKPAAMLQISFWENIQISAYFAWPISAILFVMDAPPIITLAVFFSALGNGVHRWAHMPPGKVNIFIKSLQRVGLLCSFNQHSGHHFVNGELVMKENATRAYCVMSNYLNPVLDRIKFWNLLEYVARGKA
jgi:hypothetical protein